MLKNVFLVIFNNLKELRVTKCTRYECKFTPLQGNSYSFISFLIQAILLSNLLTLEIRTVDS